MEVGKLTVTLRNQSGKGAATKLRAQGKVPGVCYGASPTGQIEPLPIDGRRQGAARRARPGPQAEHRHRPDDRRRRQGGGTLHALVKDYQIDPLRRDITHVDLLAIDPNKEVRAEVPLEFIGKPKGAIDGGQIRIVLRKLEVRAKPSDIPVKLAVDVSPLEIGDVIHVSAIDAARAASPA